MPPTEGGRGGETPPREGPTKGELPSVVPQVNVSTAREEARPGTSASLRARYKEIRTKAALPAFLKKVTMKPLEGSHIEREFAIGKGS